MRLSEQCSALVQDARYALRRLTREPVVTSVIILTLALGIGANVTTYSFVDRVLLHGPQHVARPGALFRPYVTTTAPGFSDRIMPWLPYPIFEVFRRDLRTVSALAVYRVDDGMIGSGAASRRGRIGSADPGFFPLLGTIPYRGRLLLAGDETANVAVLSESYWTREFGADPGILGRTVAIDDVPRTVIGIAPEGFTGPQLSRVDAWVPITPADRGSRNFVMVGRLRAGATREQVTADMQRLRPAYEAAAPKWAGWLTGGAAKVFALPISYDLNGHEPFEAVLARWLAGISAIILLISCANVTNLLLARLARRRRELAVRVALGSGRRRVARLLLIEGALLAIGGAALACILMLAAEPIVQRALFPDSGWRFSLFEPGVLVAILAVTAATGLLVALAPALHAGAPQVTEDLRGSARDGESRSITRSVLTVAQATLSVVLLVGAGLFLRSLQRVNAVEIGLKPDAVVSMQPQYANLPRQPGEPFAAWLDRLNTAEHERYLTLLGALRRSPEVQSAAIAVGTPSGGDFSVGLSVPGHDSIPALPSGGPYIMAVSDGYFRTVGTPLRAGRVFDEGDRASREPVVIVDETMAQQLWPGRNAVGECLMIGQGAANCTRVVGIVADVHPNGLKAAPVMQLYVPFGQESGFAGAQLVVQPRHPGAASFAALRTALMAADPSIPSIDMHALSETLSQDLQPMHLGIAAFGLSALLALLVAGMGLYSVMSHAVAWRRHEIGVRMALGARAPAIVGMVMRHGTLLATAGIAIGLGVALLLGRLVQPQLFHTSASDPLVLATSVGVLEFVALIAGWVPARRAVRVDPTEALRAD